MDEEYGKIEVFVGNNHRFQKLCIFISTLVWFVCCFEPSILPYLSAKPTIQLFNETLGKNVNMTLTKEICNSGLNYTIIHKTKFSWASTYNYDCDSLKIALIGISSLSGMMIGGFTQASVVDYFGRRKILLSSSLSYCLLILVFNFLPTSEDMFFLPIIFSFFLTCASTSCCFCTFLYVYEISIVENRPLISILLNSAFSLSGLFHIFIFLAFENIYVNYNFNLLISFICFMLMLFIFYETPKYFFIKGNFTKFLISFRNIAKFNGYSDIFEKYLKLNIERLDKLFYYEEVNPTSSSRNFSIIEPKSVNLTIKYHTMNSRESIRTSELFLGDGVYKENLDEEREKEIEAKISGKVNEIYNRGSFISVESNQSAVDDLAIFEKRYRRIDKEEKYVYSVFDLIRMKSQRYLFLKMSFLWFTIGALFYSNAVYFSTVLGDDKIIDYELNGIVYYLTEMIFYLLFGLVMMIKLMGRIKIIRLLHICVIVFIVILIIIRSYVPLFVQEILLLVLKVFISSIYVLYYIYTYEVYPVLLGAKGISMNLVTGRFGSLVSVILVEIFGGVTYIPVCVLEIISLIIVFTLPDSEVNGSFNVNSAFPPESIVKEHINQKTESDKISPKSEQHTHQLLEEDLQENSINNKIDN